MDDKKHSRLDDYWPQVLDMLKAKSGADLREYLVDAYDRDSKLYNGLYWMVDQWLISRIMVKGLSDDDIKNRRYSESVGRLRMAGYLERIKDNNQWWKPADLPRILSEIDDESKRCAEVK